MRRLGAWDFLEFECFIRPLILWFSLPDQVEGEFPEPRSILDYNQLTWLHLRSQGKRSRAPSLSQMVTNMVIGRANSQF